LKPLEQIVLRHFFYEDLSQTEISQKLDISCNYVSHLLRGGLQKLRKVITNAELIETQVRIRELQRRFNSYRSAVESYTVVDQLTELYNGKYFADRLSEEVSRACRAKDDLSILLIDISYADDPDAPIHDEVIIETAQLVRSNIRTMDIPARLGRSRFGVILPDTGISAYAPLARLTNILRTNLQGDKPLIVNTAAAHYPKDGSSAKDLLLAAEAGLTLRGQPDARAA
jgi:RNA polymerase sigma-B factor